MKNAVIGKINATKTVGVNDLIACIGQERFDGEAPLTAFQADVVFKEGGVVSVVWHCLGRADLIERLAPELLERNNLAGGGQR